MIKKLAIPFFVLVALPGVLLRFGVFGVPNWAEALVFGFAIIGAAFLLTWGAELAQLEVNQGLAIAALALIAVLPEYAVDLTFAWKAGSNPDQFAPLALANMTGANRLLIGFGWPLVVFVAALAARRPPQQQDDEQQGAQARNEIALEPEQIIEIAVLIVAAAYALSLPFRPTVPLYDTAVMVGIFAYYLWRIAQAEPEAPELVGPPAWVADFPKGWRRTVTTAMMLFAAAVILAVAEPFATSLIGVSKLLGISEFFAVQWLAPLASETPELLATALLAYNLKAAAGLGALISSKVNQWTLLVGLIPLFFALSSGTFAGLPIDIEQRDELFLTAAQTLFAASLLLNHRLTVRDAGALLGLFLTQIVLAVALPASLRSYQLLGIGGLYMLLALGLFVYRRRTVPRLLRHGLFTKVEELPEHMRAESGQSEQSVDG